MRSEGCLTDPRGGLIRFIVKSNIIIIMKAGGGHRDGSDHGNYDGDDDDVLLLLLLHQLLVSVTSSQASTSLLAWLEYHCLSSFLSAHFSAVPLDMILTTDSGFYCSGALLLPIPMQY